MVMKYCVGEMVVVQCCGAAKMFLLLIASVT